MEGTTTVDPRVIAEALRIDTFALAEMLCTSASDALPTETWLNNEVEFGPRTLESFDDAVVIARRHLTAAHEAMNAWNEDNPLDADETA